MEGCCACGIQKVDKHQQLLLPSIGSFTNALLVADALLGKHYVWRDLWIKPLSTLLTGLSIDKRETQ